MLDNRHAEVLDSMIRDGSPVEGLDTDGNLPGDHYQECPIPAYLAHLFMPRAYTLASWRALFRRLRRSGHLSMAEVVITSIHDYTGKPSDLIVLEELRQDIALLRGRQDQDFQGLAEARGPRLSDRIVHIHQGKSFGDATVEEGPSSEVTRSLGYTLESVLLGESDVSGQLGPGVNTLPAIENFDSIREGIPALFSQSVEYLLEIKPHLIKIEADLYSAHTLLKAAALTGTNAWWIAGGADEDAWLSRAESMRVASCPQHPPDRAEWAKDVLANCIELADLVIAPSKNWIDAIDLPVTLTDKVLPVDKFEVVDDPQNADLESLGQLYRKKLAPALNIQKKTRSVHSAVTIISDAQLSRWSAWLKDHVPDGLSEWFSTKGQTAQEIIKVGWKFEEFSPIELNDETAWLTVANENRTWAFTLHTWEFMDPVIREYLKTGDEALLAWAVNVAVSWKTAALSQAAEGSMAWYDMALALRSPRLVGVLHLAVQSGFSSEAVRGLLELVLAHQDAHESEASFISRNNHGFYAALGQIILSRSALCLPNMDSLLAQGESRMRFMAEQQFHEDGGHVEHSPDYHRMLLGSFQQAISQGVITDFAVQQRIEKASEALGWFVQPNGKMLQFGDSPGREMVLRTSKALSPHTRFITTDGLDGMPSRQELFVLEDTGYAIYRSPAPEQHGDLQKCSYLAFAAGFHSRAHKHCDDLSLILWDEGLEILVDGGRYGYGPQLASGSPLRAEGFYYADPARQYVESVWAHSTVAVDGKNHNRRRSPYGSGLVSAATDDLGFKVAGLVPHDGWDHSRELRYVPGRSLSVVDTISVADEDIHEYSVHFNVNGELDLDVKDDGTLSLTLGGVQVATLLSDSKDSAPKVLRGSEEPLRGWRSIKDRSLEPSWFVSFNGKFRGTLRHETRFDFNRLSQV